MTGTEEAPSLKAETRAGRENRGRRDGLVQGLEKLGLCSHGGAGVAGGLHRQLAPAARKCTGPRRADTEGF